MVRSPRRWIIADDREQTARIVRHARVSNVRNRLTIDVQISIHVAVPTKLKDVASRNGCIASSSNVCSPSLEGDGIQSGINPSSIFGIVRVDPDLRGDSDPIITSTW
jgi:hypothetical protein